MLAIVISAVLSLSQFDQTEILFAPGTVEELPTEWKTLDSDRINIGQSYWVRFSVPHYPAGDYVIQGGNWYMQNIQFYDHELNLLGVGNDLPISLPIEDPTIYLFYPYHDSKDPDLFSIKMFEAKDFLELKYEKNLFQVGFQTILIFVLLVTTFFILRSKDRVYQHYALYIGSIIIFFSYQYGLWSSETRLLQAISPSWMWIFSASLSYAYTQFARSFLDMKENDPFNYRWSGFGLNFILGIVAVESIALLFSYDIMHQLWYKSLVIGIEVILMAVFLFRIIRMNTTTSNIFMFGSAILLVVSLTGQIASTFKIAYATNLFVQIGLLLDVFILSIGISVRVSLIQRARQEAQSKLIDQLQINERLQNEYTEKLESQVKERTVDLDKRNLENETLLKEVHHRVKNNLQMITSLLNMQQRRLKTESAKTALALTKNRVKAIGLIHEHLYKHEDFSKINLKDYVTELIEMLIKSLHKGSQIESKITVQEMKVSIETAIPIGLILNELVTNSIKYGFPQVDKPKLTVEIQERDKKLRLEISDNGPGPAKAKTDSGFGQTIVQTLVENISGTISTKSSAGQFQVQIAIGEYEAFGVQKENA